MTKTITLEAPSASGRKFYTVEIAEVSVGSKTGAFTAHTVDFRYGAVGGSAKSGTKTRTPVDQAAAEAIFQELVTEKMNGPSHYIAVGEASTAFERPALTATNAEPIKCLSPRLLNDIDPARVVAHTADDDWLVQIKHDGDRVQLHLKEGRVTLFSGRSAKVRGCPKPIAESMKTEYGAGSCVLDGELVGNVLWVFDAFEVNGKGLTKQPYHERYHWLLRFDAVMESPSIKFVRAAETQAAKVALIKKARAEHAEGVCFINKNAPYEPGKPNTGGNNLRWKFRASASLIVAEHHPSKNSLDVMLADGTRIGSVTMIGKTRPSIGTVVEIEYLYCQGSLVQAVFKGVKHRCTAGGLHARPAPIQRRGGSESPNPSGTEDRHREGGTLMAGTVWKGHIAFGLVSFPVYLSVAARGDSISFNQLHKHDNSRVKQVLFCQSEDKAIPRDEIVKGYEYEKGKYVVIHDADIKKVAPKTASVMEILEFVKVDAVDPVYLESSYYVAPGEGGAKPYALLFEGMRASGYCAIAKIAMHQREHIVVIRPAKSGMMLHTMFYRSEVRAADEFHSDSSLLNEKELKLAGMLIESLAAQFEPAKYSDTYRTNLQTMIQAKV